MVRWKTNDLVRLSTLVLLLAAAACRRSEEPRSVDGGRAAHEWQLIREWALPYGSVADVRDLLIRDSADVLVLSRRPPRLINPDSSHVDLIRAQSMTNPWSVFTSHAGATEEVWDVATRSVHQLTPVGDDVPPRTLDVTWRTTRDDLPEITHGTVLRMRRFREGYLLHEARRGVLRAMEAALSSLIYYGPGGTPQDTVFDYSDSAAELFAPDPYVRFFPALPLWAVCHERSMVTYDPITSELRWLNAEFEPVRSQKLPDGPAITDADRYAYTEARVTDELGPHAADRDVRQGIEEALRRHSSRFPERGPGATSLFCSRNELALVQRFSTVDEPLGRSSTWLAVDKSGAASAISSPPGFVPLSFRNGLLGGVRLAPDDAVFLSLLRVPSDLDGTDLTNLTGG